jgi:hypothetical protein
MNRFRLRQFAAKEGAPFAPRAEQRHGVSDIGEGHVDRELPYLDVRERLVGLPSSPRTTSHIGVANMRQMRNSVRSDIGFPASIFCQYRTEYPCESMSSWLSPAFSRNCLIRAPKPLKNWDSSRMISVSILHALKRPRPI